MTSEHDTIAAPATAAGGAIAVVRVSGADAPAVCDRIFRGKIRLTKAAPNSVHYGRIVEPARTEDTPPAVSETGDGRSEGARTEPSQAEIPCSADHTGTEAATAPRSADAPHAAQNAAGHLSYRAAAAAGTARRDTSVPVAERTVDEVLVTVFRAPHSYTGEDSVEISCHGSSYIVSEILRLLIASGARTAQPGEFTTRAFLAGKMDLAQAEAVADLIASSSRAAHALASAQMRGGFSAALRTLRGRLVALMSLLELELDFSEEDVEFADRTELRETMQRIDAEIERLRRSFSLGNALKRGVAVAITGAPNVGKSTLLNRLLGEERAMVSEIAGTTRDAIEETVDIDGVLFRFIDTAGIRDTDDRLEKMGIERTHAAIERARIILRITTPEAYQSRSERGAPDDGSGFSDAKSRIHDPRPADGHPEDRFTSECASRVSGGTDLPDRFVNSAAVVSSDACASLSPNSASDAAPRTPHNDSSVDPEYNSGSDLTDASTSNIPPQNDASHPRIIEVCNKIDTFPDLSLPADVIAISARKGSGIERLQQVLRSAVDTDALYHGDPVISTARHYEALTSAHRALDRALDGIDSDLPSDLLGEELRSVLYHLGTITGEITNDEILSTIFSKFCIGK